MHKSIREIYVKDDEIIIIFDDGGVPVGDREPAANSDIILAALQSILNDTSMTDTDREMLRNMTIANFCQLLQKGLNPLADETAIKIIGAPKLEVIQYPENYTCPYCGTKGRLKVVDGHLACYACNISYGDVDELPDML